MERLSELMDSELSENAIDLELDHIKSDPEREAVWETYHLIGDALRGEVVLAEGFRERVGKQLDSEPTILAPKKRQSHRVTQRIVLPLAASVCGIAVVAWLALSNSPGISPAGNSVAPDILAASPQEFVEPGASETDSINEYLMAHQQFSPSTTRQGVVPYVRTVSAGDSAR